MPLPNGRIGVTENPLIVSPFIQENKLGDSFPPLGERYFVSEVTEFYLISETGKFFITE